MEPIESHRRRVEVYQTDNGHKPFQEWLDGLKDREGRAKITVKVLLDGARRKTMATAPSKTRARGKLKIGDDWDAITIIALSQSNPLKAIAELVENSIDAKARTVGPLQPTDGSRLSIQ